MSTTKPLATDVVGDLLGQLERAWRRSGVPRADRRAMREEVGLDLRAAASDGVDPAALLAPDVETFAREAAEARGVARHEAAYARSVAGGLVGAAAALMVAVIGSPLIYEVLVDRVQMSGRYPLPVLGAVGAWGAFGLFCLAGALVGVWAVLRGRSKAWATVWRAAVVLPVVALVVTLLTMLFARSTGYSMESGVLAVEAVLTLAGCAGALLLARRWALR